MSKSFRHKGLRVLFESGSAAGFSPAQPRSTIAGAAWAPDTAQTVDDMDIPGFRRMSYEDYY